MLVTAVLVWAYDWGFALITLAHARRRTSLFTFSITEWRTRYYRAAVEADTQANERAVDSLLNYETVKYFSNEEHEARRYDENLRAPGERAGDEPQDAGGAQPRPDRDRRARRHRDDVARGGGRGRRRR